MLVIDNGVDPGSERKIYRKFEEKKDKDFCRVIKEKFTMNQHILIFLEETIPHITMILICHENLEMNELSWGNILCIIAKNKVRSKFSIFYLENLALYE